jgi:hypothetical protein
LLIIFHPVLVDDLTFLWLFFFGPCFLQPLVLTTSSFSDGVCIITLSQTCFHTKVEEEEGRLVENGGRRTETGLRQPVEGLLLTPVAGWLASLY